MLPYIWICISSGSFLELLIWSCPVQLVPLTCNLQYASSMNRMWMVILRPSILMTMYDRFRTRFMRRRRASKSSLGLELPGGLVQSFTFWAKSCGLSSSTSHTMSCLWPRRIHCHHLYLTSRAGLRDWHHIQSYVHSFTCRSSFSTNSWQPTGIA